jgi:NAD(P)-dependent dehydrogenase (short-subunit alcohol dehydrogenase family)
MSTARAAFSPPSSRFRKCAKRVGGAIIFTSSVSGVKASAYSPTYSAAKGVVATLTKALALYLAKDHIRVNCTCPGLMDTPILPQFMGRDSSDVEGNKRRALRAVLLGRFGCPEEVAAAARAHSIG